ncbi:MAG: RNA 2',3'-cyclic phosphodiesterase [Pseudomonadota bacterium]
MSIRAFIALELPQKCQDSLASVQKQLAGVGKGVSWTRPENIHLTLKFLGYVEEAQVEAAAAAMTAAAVGHGPLRLKMKGVGAFPGVARPRVIWVGVAGEDVGRLVGLQRVLDARLAAVGSEKPEAKTYAPHLTLGRVKDPAPVRGKSPLADNSPLTKMILSLAGLDLDEFEAAELVLFKSDLKPGGAVYTKLHAVRLLAAHEGG